MKTELPSRTMLVIGAGGFVGGRLTEMAHLSGFARVRAGLRRWDSGARVARFGVDIGLCDVLSEDQLIASMRDMQTVVHCAAGSRAVIVDGTKNSLNAAYRSGVKRFVYISSAEVYGDVSGQVIENFPYKSMNDEYADAKIEAEELCMRYLSKGLPVVILRPSLVYGPFGNEYVVRMAERLYAGGLGQMEEMASGFCNLVYIDDLVQSIFLSISRPEAVGHSFNINGPDRVTWNYYIEQLAEALAIPELRHITKTKSRIKSSILELVSPVATFAGAHFGTTILGAASKLGLAGELERVRSFLHKTPTTYELKVMSRKAYYSCEKAAEILGYSPRFNLQKGLELSVKWLSHEGYLELFDPKMLL